MEPLHPANPAAPPVLWSEHRNNEGRTYWYNNSTRQSSWEKPEELKTPFERALAQTKWKEYFSQGRKYWYHTETKQSKWDMPDELMELLEKVDKERPAVPATPNRMMAPTFVASGTVGGPQTPQGAASSLPPNPSLNSTPQGSGIIVSTLPPVNGLPSRPVPGPVPVPASLPALPFNATPALPARPNLPEDPVIPAAGFATPQEAEKAFTHLLKKAGVDDTWTWDRTMRAIITDPLYKALNSLAEKKAAWQKYVDEIKTKAAEESQTRLNKARPGIRNLLRGNPNIFYYTTFPTADRLFSQHPSWLAAKVESERKQLFEEFINELKTEELTRSREQRTNAMSKVVTLFKELNIDVLTRWRNAQSMVLNSPQWKEDQDLQTLVPLDMLLAFEDYSRLLERDFEENQRRTNIEKTRKERKNREGFKELLDKLVEAGKIRARTKWKEIYPLFAEDERYLNLLGNPGSNPIELFWDVVDQYDQVVETNASIVTPILDSKGIKFNTNMSVEEFLQVVKSEKAAENLTEEDIKEVHRSFVDEANRKAAEERRCAERKIRHAQDDLRYALKKVTGIDINASFEDAIPSMQDLPEYKALENEEHRKIAFLKFVKRQKEKLREMEDEGGSTSSKRRKGDDGQHHSHSREYGREREKERERERDKEKDSRDHRYERGSSSRHQYREHDTKEGERGYDREREHRESRDYERRDSRTDYSRHEQDEGRGSSHGGGATGEVELDYGHRDRDRASKSSRDDRKGSSGAKRERERGRDDRDRRGWEDEPREWERSGKHEERGEWGREGSFGRASGTEAYMDMDTTGQGYVRPREAEYEAGDTRGTKRARVDPPQSQARDDTPEEGEI